METERLVIRQFHLDDLADFTVLIRDKMSSSDSVYDEQFPTDTQGIEGVLSYFASSDEFFAVELKAEHRVIGFVTLSFVDEYTRNLGYCIHTAYQNKGYASEAVQTLIQFAKSNKKLKKLISGTANVNLPSVKLLQKIGFQKVSESEGSFVNDANGNPIYFMGGSYEYQFSDCSKKTLILTGSPRRNGDTNQFVDVLCKQLIGEYKIVNAYQCEISPCMDCRYCWEHVGCAIQDQMQEVYQWIQKCDNILIASPIYFSELTGKLLDVGSRLQTYFCARFFQKIEPIEKPKKGAVILVGGGDGHMDKAYETACTLMHHMNCSRIHPLICCHNTNERPAMEDAICKSGIQEIVSLFNQ